MVTYAELGKTELKMDDGAFTVSTPWGTYDQNALDQQAAQDYFDKHRDYYKKIYDKISQQPDWKADSQFDKRFLSDGKTPAQFDNFEDWYAGSGAYQTVLEVAPYELMKQSGLKDNYDAVREQNFLQAVAKEKEANSKWYRKAVDIAAPLAIGAAFSTLGGAALSPLLSGSAATAATGTGAGAGAGTGSGSGLFSGINFAKDAAIKGAITGGAKGYLTSGGDMGATLKSAALGGLTGGYGESLASSFGITSDIGTRAFTGGLSGASEGLLEGDVGSALKGAATGAVGNVVLGEIQDRFSPSTTTSTPSTTSSEGFPPVPKTKPDTLSRVSGGLVNTGSGAGVPLKNVAAAAGLGALGYSYLNRDAPKISETAPSGSSSAPSESQAPTPSETDSQPSITDVVKTPTVEESRDELRDDLKVIEGASYRGSRYSNF